MTCPMKQFNVHVFSTSFFYLCNAIFSEADIMACIDFSFFQGLAYCGSGQILWVQMMILHNKDVVLSLRLLQNQGSESSASSTHPLMVWVKRDALN